jgi:hypothetical protein
MPSVMVTDYLVLCKPAYNTVICGPMVNLMNAKLCHITAYLVITLH